MVKKMGGILVLLILISGCFSEVKKSDASKQSLVETNQQELTQRSIIAENTPQDASINITVISKPEAITSGSSVDIKFFASSDTVENGNTTHYSAGDFIYHYSLSDDGGTTKVSKYSLPDNTFNRTTFVSMVGLAVDKTYTFTIKAYNKITRKVSKNSEVIEFRVVAPSSELLTSEVLLTSVTVDKPIITPNENLKITYKVYNNGSKDYVIRPYINIGDPTDLDSKNWKFVSSDNPGVIRAGQTINISEIYTLTDSVLIDAGSSSAVDKNQRLRVKIKVNDTGETKETSENNLTTVVILMTDKIKLYLDTIDIAKTSVVPGESQIVIKYSVFNPTPKAMYIKKITPKFVNADGTDVSGDWQENSNKVNDVILDSKNTVDYTRFYTLKSTATAGDVFVDAIVTATIAENFGAEVKTSNAKMRDSVKVLNNGTMSIDCWIAMPEGVKTDGTVYAGQEFTVYGKVNYNGELNFADGEMELKIDELDTATIQLGNSKIVIEKTMVNKVLEWKIKAGTKPIQGNIRLKLNNAPIVRINDTSLPVKMTNLEKVIPMSIIDKPQMLLDVGIEEDNYGGKDGIVKANTNCKVYARVYNAGGGNVTGPVTIKINYKDSITDMKLASGESETKIVNIGDKAIWTLTTPLANRRGDITFTVLDIAKDTRTNIKPEVSDAKYKVFVVLGGDLTLSSVLCNREMIKPGDSAIPIIFTIRNDGYGQVKITDINAVFTQNGVDVSAKWQKTGTSLKPDTIFDTANTDVKTMDIVVYYSLKENIYDGSDLLGLIKIDGQVKGIDLISQEILSDDFAVSKTQTEVADIVPAVANAGKDFEAKVGIPATFDGSKSTDNKGVTLYNWDFGDGKTLGGEMNPLHIYTTPGIYTVILTVNDAANNGPSTSKIRVTVSE